MSERPAALPAMSLSPRKGRARVYASLRVEAWGLTVAAAAAEPPPSAALRLAQTARSGRQSSGRPGGRCSAPSESVRPRVLLPPPPPLHPVPVCRESCFVYVYVMSYVCGLMSHLSLYL